MRSVKNIKKKVLSPIHCLKVEVEVLYLKNYKTTWKDEYLALSYLTNWEAISLSYHDIWYNVVLGV